MAKLLIVIPAYNEEASIVPVVEDLIEHYPQYDYVIVNDGSRDHTAALCRQHDFHMIDLPVNLGLAGAFQTGLRYAAENGYDCALQFDADGQHLPQAIAPMAQAMRDQQADIVIASRGLAGSGAKGARGIGAKLITWLIRRATGQTIQDPTSGMRMYNRAMIEKFVREFDIAPEPDTISLLMRKGAKVVEVPAQMRDRQGGESYLNSWSSVSYMARTCISLLLFQWFR